MKKHYDFSNARQGILHRPAKSLQIPVYLDSDIQRKLLGNQPREKKDLGKLVNQLLRSQIHAAEMLK
jgi:hypothetical protein